MAQKKDPMKKKKVVKHLKEDIKMFKREANEDKKLVRSLSAKKKSKPKTKKAKEAKIEKVMEEYKEGELRSGSKKGPKVRKRKQALAIALNEAGESRKKRKK